MVLTKRMSMKRFKNSKLTACFPYIVKCQGGSLIMNVFFSSFLSSSYYLLKSSNFQFYLSSSYYLFKPNNYSITIIITIVFTIIVTIIIIIIIIVMLINITVTVILEKSSGGEFQARNSNGMVYPYSSR